MVSHRIFVISRLVLLSAKAIQLPLRAPAPIFQSLRSQNRLSSCHTATTLRMSLPLKGNANGLKRKANDVADSPQKEVKSDVSPHKDSRLEEEHGIIDREFYPPEMTNERCKQYIANEIERPIEALDKVQKDTRSERDSLPVKDAVVHWFKCDLRISDNKALHLASEKAKSAGVPLICIHIISPQDFKAHMTSAVRVDFVLRSLEVLKEDLAALDIPLYVETVEKRKAIPERIFQLCDDWGVSHLYTNIEYEVDELRREALMTRKGLEKGIAVHGLSDTCVVSPGELSSGTGNQYAVYSPWFRAWVAYLHKHPHHLDLFDSPSKNPGSARDRFKDLFECQIPEAPENKRLTEEEKKRFRSMWPPGEHEARARLDKFVSDKVQNYKDARNFPAANNTAVVSVHLASGTLSARTAVATARDRNSTKNLDGGSKGIMTWISKVAWRDFYKHVLAHWPFVWYDFLSHPPVSEYSLTEIQ